MFLIQRLASAFRLHVRRVSWPILAAVLLVHMLASWCLLAASGEEKLTAWHAFVYFYVTTATTIGYGDLSPGLTQGRLITALFVMPVAVATFAATLAKLSGALLAFWKRHHMGKMAYDMAGHTVLVGWRGAESTRLVHLLLSDTATDDEGIVIVATGLEEHPHPNNGLVRFVNVPSYADPAVYARASMTTAGRVLVYCANDDLAISATLAVGALALDCPVVAYFDAVAPSRLVLAHYPSIEVTRPLTADIMARAAQDPGTSALTMDMLCAGDTGMTNFSVAVPAGPLRSYGGLIDAFRLERANLLGHCARGGVPTLNPPESTAVAPGDVLYYLRQQRIEPAAVFASSLASPAAALATA
ncbi:potassium channel family protein [Stenotrophomonas sp. NPDC077464]|uniref:potassium channel family protein n=1 Tax=unclassified Stenotrophomonas TaxID=196198 RepID=UPI0037D38466